MSWTRVESATVDPQLTEGIEARTADAIWSLARQWQIGEFKGDDAANPLLVSIESRSVPVRTLVLPGGEIELAGSDVPLEPLVERESVTDGTAHARVATELGRLLLRALRRAAVPTSVVTTLRSQFAPRLPIDDELDPSGRRRLELLASASLDGARLIREWTADPDLIGALLDGLGVVDPGRQRLLDVAEAWKRSAGQLFVEPERSLVGRPSWMPSRMEYQLALETDDHDGRPIRLVAADGYPGGRLDWYRFDRVPALHERATPGGTVHRAELLPAPLRFRGMPADRFWELEEGDVDLGGIEAAPEDLARVAVAGYAVVYGNNWMVVPLSVAFGTLTTVTRLTVLDDFGRETEIRSAAEVDGGGSGRAFKFFELSGDPNPMNGRAPLLFLPATVETTEAGRPLEDVRFLRDELANVAWAVEDRVESRAGNPVDVAARGPRPVVETRGRGDDDDWELTLSTPVPGHWVPLLPVRLVDDPAQPADRAQIMFQRGRVPVPGGSGRTRGALGEILVPDRRLLIHEDEIPSAGLRVIRRFQSARGADGRLNTWIGRRKGPGRGEGHSGLEFDRLDR
jgi:hypothetical protein